MLRGRPRRVIGVDLCPHVVRMACVQIQSDNRMALTDWRIIPISETDGLSPAVFDAIRSVLDAMKANDRGTELQVGTEFQETAIHRFDLPKDARDHLARRVQWAFQNKEERDTTKFISDFLEIEPSSSDNGTDALSVILAAVNREELRSLASRFRNIGYPPAAILLKAASSGGLMQRHLLPPGDGPVCEISVGMKSSRVNYFTATSDLVYSRRFNGGMISLMEAIEDGMERMGHGKGAASSRRQEAERLFFHILDSPASATFVMEAVPHETVLGWMAPVIHRMIWHMTQVVTHMIGNGDWRHIRLVVSGEIAASRRLLTLFEAAFEIPVQIWGVDPIGRGEMASSMDKTIPSPTPSERTSLVAALGFALSRQRSMNFLFTREDQWRERRRRGMHLLLTILLICCLAGVGAFWWNGERRSQAQSVKISSLRGQLAEKVMERKALLDVSQLDIMFKKLMTVRGNAEDWARRELPAALLRELALVTPSAVRLTGFSMTCPTEALPSAHGKPPPAPCEVILEGIIEGSSPEAEKILLSYVDRLGRSDLVAGAITVGSSNVEARDAFTLTRFSLRLAPGGKGRP